MAYDREKKKRKRGVSRASRRHVNVRRKKSYAKKEAVMGPAPTSKAISRTVSKVARNSNATAVGEAGAKKKTGMYKKAMTGIRMGVRKAQAKRSQEGVTYGKGGAMMKGSMSKMKMKMGKPYEEEKKKYKKTGIIKGRF